ncbi:MAG: efflux RND transporter periplasmic adaptor subunit [Pseudomonadota bacterium]
MEQQPTKEERPTLAKALRATFDPLQSGDGFAQDLARLTSALTTAKETLVVADGDGTTLAANPPNSGLSAQLRDQILAADLTEPQQIQDAVCAAIALPDGRNARLVVRLTATGATTRALAFERLVSLSQLSFAMYRHPDIGLLDSLLTEFGKGDATPAKLSSMIRSYVDADLVALAYFQGGRASQVALSDQPNSTNRATLPEEVERSLTATINGVVADKDIYTARLADKAAAIKVETPRRNASVLPLLAQAALAGDGGDTGRTARRRKGWVKLGVAALVILGICLIPLPDARRVPAEVIAVNARTVTAPLSGIILSVSVSDGDRVVERETELARLATNDITQELATAQAEYSRALLEREGARGARDAAALRNAELEAESLRARIDLLENRRNRAQIIAPIDGVVVGDSLSTLLSATVRQGDTLLEIVDPSALALKLEVPDDLLLRIKDGENGVFRPDFAPSQSFAGAVESISPAQSTRTDIAVFEGRASLPDDISQLQPGLRGLFVFDREYRLLSQIVYDAIRDWVLLRVWL